MPIQMQIVSPKKTRMTTRNYSGFKSALPHPGEHLREDYLPEYGLSPGALAKAMGLKDRTRIERSGAGNPAGDAGHSTPAREGVRHLGGFLDEPSGAARSFHRGHRRA